MLVFDTSCVGVIGGVFVCMGYAIRITTRAVEVVSGADQTPGIVAAESSGVKVGLRSKWGGGELRARPQSGRMVRQGNGWVLEGVGSNSGSPVYGGGGSYASTPVSATFASSTVPSPYLASPFVGPGTPPVPQPHGLGQATGLGFSPSTFHPAPDMPVDGYTHMRPPPLVGGPPRVPFTPSLQANGATMNGGSGEDKTGDVGVHGTLNLPATPGSSATSQQQQGPPRGKKDD